MSLMKKYKKLKKYKDILVHEGADNGSILHYVRKDGPPERRMIMMRKEDYIRNVKGNSNNRFFAYFLKDDYELKING